MDGRTEGRKDGFMEIAVNDAEQGKGIADHMIFLDYYFILTLTIWKFDTWFSFGKQVNLHQHTIRSIQERMGASKGPLFLYSQSVPKSPTMGLFGTPSRFLKKEGAPGPPITIIQTNHMRKRGMTFHQIGNDSKIAHKNKYFHLNRKQANSRKTFSSDLQWRNNVLEKLQAFHTSPISKTWF